MLGHESAVTRVPGHRFGTELLVVSPPVFPLDDPRPVSRRGAFDIQAFAGVFYQDPVVPVAHWVKPELLVSSTPVGPLNQPSPIGDRHGFDIQAFGAEVELGSYSRAPQPPPD